MNAGQLRERITVQTPTETITASGEASVTWTTLATRWAEVVPLAGRELFTARQVQPEVTHRVRLRRLAGITTKMQLLYRGRILKILSAIDVGERRVSCELMCKEAV
jgi:SPP1 family predicted phage head-tail adaptor